ncbi:hypothetical protein MAM1_0042c02980 [Mucor ambiguus]|uniref:Uncharacterized protein n=1 Tax=Mucor ambiguus TaxID=91626 RepID=A0A0C9LT90_9FUNG|nr:hypothetical protein MAM1_0042c02980 [Mucor ambiguus]
MAENTSLTSEESGIKQSWNRALKWFDRKWNGERDENTPLLNRERGTVEPPRKTTFRIVTTIVAIVVALVLLGVTVGLWYNKYHGKKSTAPGMTQAEKLMLQSPSTDNLRHYLKTYTSEAHLAGTPNDKKQAEWTRDQFESIELNGTIALMRNGGNFRGLKVRVAEIFGCVGALIFTDPIDDGPLKKDGSLNPAKSYPDGPWRSKSSVQRGSVGYVSLFAGDPLTPGYPATENATRINIDDALGLPKIPSLPLLGWWS